MKKYTTILASCAFVFLGGVGMSSITLGAPQSGETFEMKIAGNAEKCSILANGKWSKLGSGDTCTSSVTSLLANYVVYCTADPHKDPHAVCRLDKESD
ncbi:MAG: hypothetical protein COB66_04300 [Coxiella sp. (in: Bacteria)]|nr:MAG: hypothetical protein COB66_04300 [Coxiella sp. (in: g-proteobacteria)]